MNSSDNENELNPDEVYAEPQDLVGLAKILLLMGRRVEALDHLLEFPGHKSLSDEDARAYAQKRQQLRIDRETAKMLAELPPAKTRKVQS